MRYVAHTHTHTHTHLRVFSSTPASVHLSLLFISPPPLSRGSFAVVSRVSLTSLAALHLGPSLHSCTRGRSLVSIAVSRPPQRRIAEVDVVSLTHRHMHSSGTSSTALRPLAKWQRRSPLRSARPSRKVRPIAPLPLPVFSPGPCVARLLAAGLAWCASAGVLARPLPRTTRLPARPVSPNRQRPASPAPSARHGVPARPLCLHPRSRVTSCWLWPASSAHAAQPAVTLPRSSTGASHDLHGAPPAGLLLRHEHRRRLTEWCVALVSSCHRATLFSGAHLQLRCLFPSLQECRSSSRPSPRAHLRRRPAFAHRTWYACCRAASSLKTSAKHAAPATALAHSRAASPQLLRLNGTDVRSATHDQVTDMIMSTNILEMLVHRPQAQAPVPASPMGLAQRSSSISSQATVRGGCASSTQEGQPALGPGRDDAPLRLVFGAESFSSMKRCHPALLPAYNSSPPPLLPLSPERPLACDHAAPAWRSCRLARDHVAVGRGHAGL